jgi:hypothetical protein
MTDDIRARGRCLCGAVEFEVHGPLRPVIACHCGQCRRWSGHYVAATGARRSDIRFNADEALTWFRSSARAKRGFCRVCGSSLFWSEDDAPDMSIMAGALEPPTGLHTVVNIMVQDKSDYYELDPDVPHIEGHDHRIAVPEK